MVTWETRLKKREREKEKGKEHNPLSFNYFKQKAKKNQRAIMIMRSFNRPTHKEEGCFYASDQSGALISSTKHGPCPRLILHAWICSLCALCDFVYSGRAESEANE